MPSAELVKEDDYFRVGDDVIVTQYTEEMNNSLRNWVVGSQAKVVGIRAGRRAEYCIGFAEEKHGLHSAPEFDGLPDRKRRYQSVRKNDIVKLELPKFRSVEKEAEYFRNEYIKIRGKSLSVLDEIRRKKDNELQEMKNRIENMVGIPVNSINWHREGFIVTRIGDFSLLTIMQKRAIEINSFVCANFSVNLPEELIYRGSAYFACNFNGNGEFVGYGVYTPKFKPFVSFHTGSDSQGFSRVCIGDLNIIPKLDMNEIRKALDEYQKLLTIANPYSYLNTHFDSSIKYQKKMQDILNYVQDYHNKYYEQNSICRNCNRNADECECEMCENCHMDYDDCECYTCAGCDGRVEHTCSNELCDDCCGNNCSHCPNCGESYEGYCEGCDRGISCGCCRCKSGE